MMARVEPPFSEFCVPPGSQVGVCATRNLPAPCGTSESRLCGSQPPASTEAIVPSDNPRSQSFDHFTVLVSMRSSSIMRCQ
ncbi:Hypothetical protein PFR_JS20-2_1427 [Propionibacterium freudenreichii]|nr:Hypothetical protein PFR_JS20-1_1420 [Propionibacterium freudenreichii]SCQ82492.1 Hypothetical protein PFR_JS20-2_1427 [Propionibacterium freudenreichii]